ncbi:hypothetical protein APASM_1393 [Actinosynnema pretiosum subsp. pretiosum]|nr:hypothetical protein APASM_1393 [Actinosynnema pretiosum subsp. pretiosum]
MRPRGGVDALHREPGLLPPCTVAVGRLLARATNGFRHLPVPRIFWSIGDLCL